MRLLPPSATADAALLLWARSLRAFADGFVSIILPVYLLRLGHSPFEVGVIATATLLGSAGLTLSVGAMARRFHYRRLLLAAAALMFLTGVGFATVEAFWPLLLIAFIGTLNPSSGDVSVFLPLEQALLASNVADADRTALFARYSLVGSLLGALGTLLAAVPEVAAARLGLAEGDVLQAMFGLYAIAGLSAAALYRNLSDPAENCVAASTHALGPSRRIVFRLAGLFSIDSFGGGFFVQSLLALWLFQAFGLSVATAAQIFFWTNLLTAASYLAAVPIARRFGLVNTMVFTHLPANLCLIAIPFVENLSVVIGLLMVRSLLSQMDVPTRTSYVMAVVTPSERPAAASITAVPRSLASSASPIVAGYLLTLTSFGWPLLIGGVLKAGYDIALLFMFRRVRPPEERK